MTQLSEKEKKTIAARIASLEKEHVGRFPYAKYPQEPFKAWKSGFCDPEAVTPETINQALSWQFGFWQRKSLPFAQRQTILETTRAWPTFVESAASEPQLAFSFWQDKLADRPPNFDAVALLLHLLHPDSLELADRHRIEAMYELLKEVGHDSQVPSLQLSLQLLTDYTAFFRSIYPKLPYGDESRIKLDRFLKSYGNRHAYKNVSSTFSTREPLIRSFSWDNADSSRFLLDEICLRANADRLFACFLLGLESENHPHNDLAIGDVVERIPLGTGGMCNEASFNYALVALFGGQRQRDYWIFDKPEIKHAFTEQANQSTRNMRFYITHAAERLSVNPKYVRESEAPNE